MPTKHYTHATTQAPANAVSAGSVAIGVPSPEVLHVAIKWLTAHRAPDDLQDVVAALVAQNKRALGVSA